MTAGFSQGDVIKIQGFRFPFLVVSKSAFIKSTGHIHVCPLLVNGREGPVHIAVSGSKGASGIAACEQIKLIDPSVRACSRIDRISYAEIMEVSDVLQGIFEYD